MIVFVAGMQRSGSTFSFNVARDILRNRGKVFQDACPSIVGSLDRAGNDDHIILKAHGIEDSALRLIQVGGAKAICTVRKPEDAIASWMEVFEFGLDQSISEMRAWIDLFSRLRKYALLVRYEEIDKSPRRAAWRIAKYMYPSASVFEIISIAQRHLKPRVKEFADKLAQEGRDVESTGFSYYDRSTFFHRRHVSSLVSRGAAERIGIKSVEKIRHELREFINKEGDILFLA